MSLLLAFFCGGLATVPCVVFIRALLRASHDDNNLVDWWLGGALATAPVLIIAANFVPPGISDWMMVPVAIVCAPIFVGLVYLALIGIVGGVVGVGFCIEWLTNRKRTPERD